MLGTPALLEPAVCGLLVRIVRDCGSCLAYVQRLKQPVYVYILSSRFKKRNEAIMLVFVPSLIRKHEQLVSNQTQC